MTIKGDIEKFKDPRVARAVASFIPRQVLPRVVRNPDKLDRVGERRTVTAMFVDIAGFTPYCENRDAEEVMLLLNKLFAAILEPVERYSGAVDKFMGDAAVVIFGAPVAHEDDPQRALAAAIEIMNRIGEFHGLHVSIGINTGEVVAGIVGDDKHREYTVIGDAVNTASRLQTVAEAGQILVGAETKSKVKAGFKFGDSRKLSLKGKSKSIEAFPLWDITADTVDAGRLRVIGRKKELSRLFDILDADETGSALILGEAGSGKSALTNRVATEAESRGIRIIDISAITWAENIPYAPIQYFIRELLGVNPQRKFQQILTDQIDFFPLLSGLLGIEIPHTDRTRFLSPEEKRLALQDLIYGLLTSTGRNNPVLLICDNIENLDPSTGELIDRIIDEDSLSILLSGRNPGPIKSRVDEIINLKPLNKRDVGELIRESLGAKRVGADFVSAVHSETHGNPGYIVELVTLLADRGDIFRDRGVHRISTSIEGKLPRGIDGIYTARIDEFPPDARETIRVSSVLGQEFPKTLPEELMETTIYKNGASYLQSNGIIRPDDGKFRFQSLPLMKAAYHSLFHTVRKKLHASAGESIEKRYHDNIEDHYEELARHFGLGEKPRKAFQYRFLSGRKQEARFANLEALHYYEQALSLPDDKATDLGIWRELLNALESAGRLYWYSGDLRRVIELNVRAKAIAEKHNATSLVTDAINRIALAKQEMGQLDEAGKLYEQLLETLRPMQNEHERLLQAMVNYGTLLSDLGKLESARQLYLKGLEIADTEGASAGAANLLGNLGWLESHLGNWNSAVEYLRRATEIDEELGNLRGLAINKVNLAQAFRARGSKAEEIRAYEEAEDIFARIGDRRGEALCLANLGDTARETGDIERAKSLHRKALKLSTELKDKMRIVDSQLGLARDSYAEGDMKNAINRANKAFETSIAAGDWEGQIDSGLSLLKFHLNANNESVFKGLANRIRKIILENNPVAISRLEAIEEEFYGE